MLLLLCSFVAVEMPQVDLNTGNKAIFHRRRIPAECFQTFLADASFWPMARRVAEVPGSRPASVRDWLSDMNRQMMATLRDGAVTNQSHRRREGR